MNIGLDARLINETGVGRYTRALITNLGKLDQENHYTLFLRSQDAKQISLPNSRWQAIEANVSWHSVNEQLQMPAIFAKSEVDLVHIPYFSVPILMSTPFIVTIHDLIISHFATGKATTKPLPIYAVKRLGYRLVLANAVKRSRHIITVSGVVKDQIEKEYSVNAKKISVTYESGELESVQKTTEIQTPKKYILYVGNAHPHKNIQRLIEAFALVLSSIPDCTLVCIGKHDFFYGRLIRYVQQLRLGKNILFPGEVTNRELKTWYKSATAFIFPSLSEGFGIPGLEAMGQNCPVLAANLPVFREIYEDAAHYFDQMKAETIAQAIIDIFMDKTLGKKLQLKGEQQVKKYSWERMAKQTLQIYESCVGLRSGQ